MVAAGRGVRVTSEVAALFAAMSARAGRNLHIVQPGAHFRRQARKIRHRREIWGLVVADQYTGIGDETVGGGERWSPTSPWHSGSGPRPCLWFLFGWPFKIRACGEGSSCAHSGRDHRPDKCPLLG